MHNIHMIPQGCICRNVLSTFNSVPKIELTWMCTFFTWFPKASLARKLFSILVALASTYQNSVPPIYTVRGGLGQGWITNFSSGSRKPVSILNMFFHVCPKTVWPVRFIITMITFFQFCVFSSALSNCLDQRKHNHIGCICVTFLHCASSNVPSNCLPEQMQSHTGCICLVFIRCVFSNVSSNCLPELL